MVRHQAAVDDFVERFAGDLEAAGVPHLPARVFVTLLVEDDGYLSAAELADRLHISPAAVSGAVRYLIQVQLVRRDREPGSRRDRYRISDDTWYEVSVSRQAMLDQWSRTLAAGTKALGSRTPAGARMRETHDFIEFLRQELPALLAKWRRRRAAQRL
jgi:DNA-binding transcriptional regulator GbsR (MarR family)